MNVAQVLWWIEATQENECKACKALAERFEPEIDKG